MAQFSRQESSGLDSVKSTQKSGDQTDDRGNQGSGEHSSHEQSGDQGDQGYQPEGDSEEVAEADDELIDSELATG